MLVQARKAIKAQGAQVRRAGRCTSNIINSGGRSPRLDGVINARTVCAGGLERGDSAVATAGQIARGRLVGDRVRACH